MIFLISAFVAAFFIGMFIAPLAVSLFKKLKARQTILSYVEQHKSKDGVPTMGGVIFLIAAAASSLIFWRGEKDLAVTALIVTLAYGLIGFLDDALKAIFKRNLGLKAYQKIVSQTAIAVLATLFAYRNQYLGADIYIPMFNSAFHIGWWYLPISFLVYIATTNAVNLTDGLDGLAGSSVCIYFAVFFAIIGIMYSSASADGRTFYAKELYNLMIFIASLVGGITAFLWHNSHRAKIFMGDTGSLALGGACAFVALAVQNPLLILIVGIVFVVSSLSVIIQVISFKLRKKRVFLMSPFHHHLEMKGVNESKIVAYYSIITVVAGLVAIAVF